ncbi:MAG: hypothetical protein INR69_12620 [Mucilaginibacter polytrichastri]|nr:hypothetical protein [Mucilaginibacter polytrichastri]
MLLEDYLLPEISILFLFLIIAIFIFLVAWWKRPLKGFQARKASTLKEFRTRTGIR